MAGTTRRVAIGTATAAILSACDTADAAASPLISGVPYVRGRRILRDGRPYRAVGCNYFNSLNVASRRQDFQLLTDMRIPFCRVNFGQFWSGTDEYPGWNLYFKDRERWFGALDDLMADAEQAGLGVIPTMFFRIQTLPDLMRDRYGVRDSVSAWGHGESRTRSWMRQITAETVQRYRRSPAIWGWEMGNEMWSPVHTPLHLSGGRVDRGSPERYVDRIPEDQAVFGSDVLTSEALNAALADWSRTVRENDNSPRIRSSGSAGGAWRRWDRIRLVDATRSLNLENPSNGGNVVSCHIYTGQVRSALDRDLSRAGFADLLHSLSAVANRSERPLFLGEFGALGALVNGQGSGVSDNAAERLVFADILGGVVDSDVPLAALWDFGNANYGGQKWGVAPGGLRAYQLEAIAQANQNFQVAHTTRHAAA